MLPLRTFHRLTIRNGGINCARDCFDCGCVITFGLEKPPEWDDDDEEVEVVDGGGLHSTAAMIHPFAAATQWACGGSTARVVEAVKSASSMSSVLMEDLLPERPAS